MGTRPVTLIGRHTELAAVDAFLDSALSGCSTLVLQGEPGIGKTSVWQEALRRAEDRGASLLVTRGTQAEAGLSLSGLTDLLQGAANRLAEELPMPQRAALLAALLRSPAPAGGIDERALCAAVVTLLRLVARQGPVVVAVDDAQWLDPPTSRVLAFAIRRLDESPVSFLAVVRTADAPMPSFADEADADRRTVLRLGPLTLAALHELLKQRTGSSLARPRLVRLARACAGNPLYALEVAEAMRLQPADAVIPAPPSLNELIAARLRLLPERSRNALLMAAALSQPTTEQVDPQSLLAGERAGFVSIEPGGRIRFAHPLFSSAVYSLADPASRRRVHQRLARTAQTQEERARHAALGATRADEGIAAELETAARLLASRGAPGSAAELVDLALRLTPDGEESPVRSERLVLSAGLWFASGDLARAELLLADALARTTAGSTRGRALQMAGQLHARRSSFPEALEYAHKALEATDGDLQLRASIDMDIAYCWAGLGNAAAAEPYAIAAVEAAEEVGEEGPLAEALGVVTIVEFLCGRGFDEDRIRRALRLEDPGRTVALQMRPSFIYGHILMWLGRLPEALRTLGELREHALERGEESPIPILALYLAWTCVWHGDFAQAGQFAEEARRTSALLGDPAAIGSAFAASAMVHAHEGSIPLAREESAVALECFRRLNWLTFFSWPLWALGLAELSDGNPAGTHAAVGQLSEQFRGMGSVEPVLAPFLPDEIEALVELGDLDQAERLVDWLECRGTELDRPWALAVAARGRGLLQAVRGDPQAGLASLRRAMTENERVEIPFEKARTLLVLGQLQRRVGKRAEARRSLDQAFGIFDWLGARRWAARASAEMDRLGKRPPVLQGLTPTEARIAELAASGMANREIARRVSVSAKSVEANLTRTYRKLGIRSRAGLARALVTPSGRVDGPRRPADG